MPDYDFSSLSDSEFEFLVADLGQKRFGEYLQRFERGRDAGIDCRYLAAFPVLDLADAEIKSRARNSLVVQCKHYRKSGFVALLRDMEKKEVAKITKLAPTKYVLATSVGLSPAQEAKLLSVLSPVCADVEIWGRLTINALLSEFPEIEKQHFKLWLTCTSTIERILNNRIFNQTRFEFEEVRLKLSRYVSTDSFHRAKQMLEKNGYCVIAGIPGIGKTTLAQILAAEYLEKGFRVVFASCGIDDVLDISLPEVKEFFVLDDFWGRIFCS
ncbi:MAG: hypothetical protein Q8T09_19600 [Candidatus Melainabacteria bacterium]|nr:hypothetical protein [Candidatus Melainabacteria bacterium]